MRVNIKLGTGVRKDRSSIRANVTQNALFAISFVLMVALSGMLRGILSLISFIARDAASALRSVIEKR